MADKDPRIIYQLTTQPGFSRDGTILDRPGFVDGQWVRFQRGRPRKVGGYKEISRNLTEVVRGSFVYPKDQLEFMYGFSKNIGWLSVTTQEGASCVASQVTLPTLANSDDYTFQTDSIYDINGSGNTNILVHGASNIMDIASEVNTPILWAEAGLNPPTYSTVDDGNGGTVSVSGGIVVLQPYVFAYGNNGLIKNSNQNDPNNWVIAVGNDANEANVAGTKIVKGLPLRAGANSPAGLFWSLDSLIRVSRVGTEFRYDTLSAQTSVLAPNSAVEYDGVYYWIGVDRFLMFNGTVSEVKNTNNFNWFFDNVNYRQRAKIWGVRNTRYGEIWWFFPYGEAEECTHAIIYNIRENVWYDLALGRSAGFASQVFRFPIMFGNTENSMGDYSNFAHEFGVDAVLDGDQVAIPSYFETSDFGYPTGGAEQESTHGNDYYTRVERIEPDFIMSGDMTVQVRGSAFAQSPDSQDSVLFTFDENTGKIDMREQRRQIRLKFESNVLGGNYQMGRVIMHLETGDIRS